MTKKEFRKLVEPEIEICKTKAKIDFFDFIENGSLKSKLVKSYKETIFIKNLVAKLSLQYSDAHPFNEIQIIHYASIYEAIIDYSLEEYYSNDIKNILEEITLTKIQIGKTIEIINNNDGSTLHLCKEKVLKKKLSQVKFETRVKKAVDLGIVESKMQNELTELYDYRNHIHILKATSARLKYTKELVENYCKEDTLIQFCKKMKSSIVKQV